MVRLGERFNVIRARQPLSPGVWHHIAGVDDGDEIRLYVSGRLVNSRPATGRRNSNTMPFIVGAGPQLKIVRNNAFLGAVDKMRLSTIAGYVRSSVSIARKHPPDPDTFLPLKFDRPRSPIFLDSSGNRRNGILAGATALEQE